MTSTRMAVRRRAHSGAVTLKDVAERAGVAPITVSRALNAPDSVSAALRAQIDEAVGALGYVRNQYAGALASAASRIIPVIVPSLSNAVFVEVIQGIQQVLEEAGYQPLLGNTQYDLERESKLVATLLGWSPAGLIVAGMRHSERTRTLLRGYGRPLVEIMEYGAQPIDMNVGLSHIRAGETMGRHLVGRGYRQIGFIGGRLKQDYRAAQRFRGLDNALAAVGLPRRPPFEHDERSSALIGGDTLMQTLQRAPELDALFFANDDLAVGALLRAQREGIAVPARVAIAGFNGLDISALTTPALTTIVSPRQRIGELAARKLLGRIQGEKPGPARIDVGFRLEIRAST
ncbi:LacI family DNA-binding transcriptional regulator [Lichenicoccus sp.]|uniref:LacI family DNA-binding transcriptional regulator n=1 Tax=Lichenicoccus sp. TaxID=2781899 RepID=UPI003D0F96A8